MAGIYSALGELDRMRKMAGRRVKDLVTDPLGVLTQQADDLRNTQRGVEPVINPAGAGMRPIPREEQVSRMTEQSLDTLGGGLGMLGHTVFHGSPRAFSKFDKAKMGTGEWGGRAPTEFEARHAAAQRNAALPVEQGGLGLPPNNTAMERANAMGYENAYHGATTPIEQIDPSKAGGRLSSNPSSHLGFFSTPNAKEASRYATDFGGEGANVMPLMVRRGNSFDMPNKQFDQISMGEFYAKGATPQERYSSAVNDATSLKDSLVSEGYDSITRFKGKPMEEIVSINPSNVRSRFAAFDPMKRHDADMLGFASPQLLGGMGLGGAGMAAYGLQDDQEGIFSRLGQYLRQRGMQ